MSKALVAIILFFGAIIGFINFEQFFPGNEKLLLFAPVIVIAGFILRENSDLFG